MSNPIGLRMWSDNWTRLLLFDLYDSDHSSVSVTYDVAVEEPETRLGCRELQRVGLSRHQRQYVSGPDISSEGPDRPMLEAMVVVGMVEVSYVDNVESDNIALSDLERGYCNVKLG